MYKIRIYIEQTVYFSHSTDGRRDDSMDAGQTEDTGDGSQP